MEPSATNTLCSLLSHMSSAESALRGVDCTHPSPAVPVIAFTDSTDTRHYRYNTCSAPFIDDTFDGLENLLQLSAESTDTPILCLPYPVPSYMSISQFDILIHFAHTEATPFSYPVCGRYATCIIPYMTRCKMQSHTIQMQRQVHLLFLLHPAQQHYPPQYLCSGIT